MSALPRDLREQALGKFLRTSDGADAFRDACGNDLVALIGELSICGDKAAIGSLVLDYMLADKGMQHSMAFADAAEEAQNQRDLFEAACSDDEGNFFPPRSQFLNYDQVEV